MNYIQRYFQKIQRKAGMQIAARKDVKLEEKYLVFESDDWGSLRMPSLRILHDLTNKGLRFFTDIGYDKYDSIESNTDVEILMETLLKYRDNLGNPPVITMNGVVANPDFEEIERSSFTNYQYETIDKTYQKQNSSNHVFELIKEGKRNGCFHPQFHGREHLNVPLWMNLLLNRHKDALTAFDYRVWSMKINRSFYHREHCLAAYDAQNKEECELMCKSILEGLLIFKDLWGYSSASMIAPNYTWGNDVEEAAFKSGVVVIQGSRVQRLPLYLADNGLRNPIRHIGQKNRLGQLYLIRNCIWEPSQREYLNSDFCFNQVCQAFSKGRPAIVSAHRLNFMGRLDKNNRSKNITDFKRLLDKIITTYPDVRFVSSDKLGNIINKNIINNN